MRSANRFSGHATNDRGGLILAALSLLSLLAGPSTVLRAQEPLSPPSSQVSSQVSSQTASPIAAHPIVPQLLSYTGVAANRAGDAVEATFRVYAAAQGGEPLWQETQRVQVDREGKFPVLLGAATQGGLPQSLFAAGDGQWLAVSIEQSEEQPRVKLASVAYAMKAADAETLGGAPAASFVTQSQLAAAAAALTAQAAQRILPDTTPSGAGSANYLAYWTGSATLGDSAIYQGGTAAAPLLGINSATPATTLDVNGSATIRGTLKVFPTTKATPAAGVASPLMEVSASSWNSAAAAAQAFSFGWQAVPGANNSATPYADVNLMYSANGAGPVWTGLSIGDKGLIRFTNGQTFPGAGTITGVTTASPLTGSAASGSVAIGLNLTALQTTLNASYAQLNAANKFAQPITFASGQTYPGAGTITGITTGAGLLGGGTTGLLKLTLDRTAIPTLSGSPVFTSPASGLQGVTEGNYLNSAGVQGLAGNPSGLPGGITGVWGDAYAHVGVLGTSYQYSGVQGVSATSYGVQGSSTSNTAVLGISTSGTGVSGLSTSSSGVAGYTPGSTINTAGVLGKAGAPSGTLQIVAGVWGDSYQQVGVEGTSNQSVGVYGQSTIFNGVEGISNAAIGVSGLSTSGTGMAGSSTSGAGMVGYTAGTTLNTAGAIGIAGPRTGFTGISGLWGDAANHVGVQGTSNVYAGVQGSSVSAPGVQGNSTSGNGVHGVSASTSGIFGETSSTSGGDAALYGLSHNGALGVFGFSPQFGIEGESGGNSAVGSLRSVFVNGPAAVWGDTSGAGYAVAGTTDNGIAGEFINSSASQDAMYVGNFYNGNSNVAEFAGTGGECSIFGNGDVLCTGTISASTALKDGEHAVKTYSVQSAENWYEDAGSAQLIKGVAHVQLDPAFGQTVNTGVEYHVFLTPNGDSEGLFVSNKTADGFEVHEQHGGRSNIAFDYRIMAKRAGHENERLEDVTGRMKNQAEMRAQMLRAEKADPATARAPR